MGVFSNIWKGVKKTFKKIGKGVKGAFKKFGKFMGKAGILGTVAMGLLTGGAGFGAMLGQFGTFLGSAGASGTLTGSILNGASWVVGKAVQFGNMVTSGFKTLTSGVTEFFGQTGRYIGSKLGIPGAPTDMTILGEKGLWDNYSKALTENFSQFTSDVSSFASKSAASGLKSTATQVSYDPYGSEAVKEKAMEEALKDSNPSLLGKLGESAGRAVKNIGTSIEQVPGQIAGQSLIQYAQGTPEYEKALSMSYVEPTKTASPESAIDQALTPMMTDDQQFANMFVNYDTGVNGAFGNIYSNRIKAFAGQV